MKLTDKFFEVAKQAIRSESIDKVSRAQDVLAKCVEYGFDYEFNNSEDMRAFNSIPDYLKEAVNRYYDEVYSSLFEECGIEADERPI